MKSMTHNQKSNLKQMKYHHCSVLVNSRYGFERN